MVKREEQYHRVLGCRGSGGRLSKDTGKRLGRMWDSSDLYNLHISLYHIWTFNFFVIDSITWWTFSSSKISFTFAYSFWTIDRVSGHSAKTCQTVCTPVPQLQILFSRGIFEYLPVSIANECEPVLNLVGSNVWKKNDILTPIEVQSRSCEVPVRVHGY